MPRPKSDLVIMSIKLGEADREALKSLAESDGTTKNQVIRDLIRTESERRKGPTKPKS